VPPLRDAVRFVNGEERERGVELRGAHAEFAECGDLVVHEGDEWRDHDADGRPHEGGDLVAERLAAARGHEHQRVTAGGYVLNDLGLLAVSLHISSARCSASAVFASRMVHSCRSDAVLNGRRIIVIDSGVPCRNWMAGSSGWLR